MEEIPIDIVAALLGHADWRATGYYGKAPPSLVQERMDGFLSRFSSYVNLGEAVLRAPEEVRRQLEAARGQIGTLNKVKGGRCVQPGFCPAKSACIGCPCKAPEPEQRSDVEQERTWAVEQREMAIRDGRTLDVGRMEQLIRECDTELKEMDLIDQWRRDEARDAKLNNETEATPRGSIGSFISIEDLGARPATRELRPNLRGQAAANVATGKASSGCAAHES